MEIKDLFKSILAIETLDIDNTALEKFCKDRINESFIYKDFNQTQSQLLDLNDPVLAVLKKAVEEKVNEFHAFVGLNNRYRQKITECWANVNNPRYVSVPHEHAESVFSCVYYVKGGEDSGNIVFVNPNSSQPRTILSKHIQHFNPLTSNTFYQTPSPGKLLIFPSWVYHYVHANDTDEERISIAFNTVFEEIL